jgi:hypothetical protein
VTSGAVHHEVEPLCLGDDVVDERLDLVRLAHVADSQLGLGVACCDLGNRLLDG